MWSLMFALRNMAVVAGGDNMATSTFGKNFVVKRGQANDFVREMKRTVTPTLKKDFSTKFMHLSHDNELSSALSKALGK